MEGVPAAPTNAFSLGNNPLPFSPPLLSVIPSEPGFPAALLSPATPDVVLFKENHTQPTEAAILDRKSGEGEESAVRHSGAPKFTVLQPLPLCRPEESAVSFPLSKLLRRHPLQQSSPGFLVDPVALLQIFQDAF